MDIETLTVEMFTPVGNYGVLRLPGRTFPAVIVQGDSLDTMVHEVREIVARTRSSDDEELRDVAKFLLEQLVDVQAHYERVLAEHGIRLPYAKP